MRYKRKDGTTTEHTSVWITSDLRSQLNKLRKTAHGTKSMSQLMREILQEHVNKKAASNG